MSDRVVFVTGARGFLGTYVVAEAARRGYRVLTADTLRFPSTDARAFLIEHRPPFVVHAAGPSSVARSFEDPSADFNSSVAGTHCLFDALRAAACRPRVAYLSSAAVYGESTALPMRELELPRPISPYGFHKLCAETLVREHAQLHGMSTASLRIFSAYGPGLPRQVVYDLARRIRPSEPLRLDGTGHESRDFIHATDVARATFDVLERAPGKGEIYNVASGQETTIRTLAEHLRALRGPGPIEFSGKVRKGDPTNWRADVTALASLGFAPSIALTEGLRQVSDWVTTHERTAPTA